MSDPATTSASSGPAATTTATATSAADSSAAGSTAATAPAAPVVAPAPTATSATGTSTEPTAAATSSDAGAAGATGAAGAAGAFEDRLTIKANGVCYLAERIIGNGSFGVVFQACVADTKEVVAVKKVLQDKRFKNRELQIMKLLSHPNVVALKNSFYTTGDKPDEVFLNLVLEYIPDTVYRVARNYSKVKQAVPMQLVKLYTYQLARALGYIHSQGICHRDIKPQNLLLDSVSGILKLCDFGSAKILVRGEPNVSYICSRYYRAPELIFGATNYSPAIDVWSMGCVMAELLLGQPLFPGESGVDQLVEIIKILGTPTREQIEQMNQNYTEFKFPQIKPHPWSKVFRPRTPPEAIDLIVHMLSYTPTQRYTPLQVMCHPFFDELREPGAALPSGRPLPPLFNLSLIEISCVTPAMNLDYDKLSPPHTRAELPAPVLAHLEQLIADRAAQPPAPAPSAAAPASASASAPTAVDPSAAGGAPSTGSDAAPQQP